MKELLCNWRVIVLQINVAPGLQAYSKSYIWHEPRKLAKRGDEYSKIKHRLVCLSVKLCFVSMKGWGNELRETMFTSGKSLSYILTHFLCGFTENNDHNWGKNSSLSDKAEVDGRDSDNQWKLSFSFTSPNSQVKAGSWFNLEWMDYSRQAPIPWSAVHGKFFHCF